MDILAGTVFAGENAPREKLIYRSPRLVNLGTMQTFVLGGDLPFGTDAAFPEEDSSTS